MDVIIFYKPWYFFCNSWLRLVRPTFSKAEQRTWIVGDELFSRHFRRVWCTFSWWGSRSKMLSRSADVSPSFLPSSRLFVPISLLISCFCSEEMTEVSSKIYESAMYACKVLFSYRTINRHGYHSVCDESKRWETLDGYRVNPASYIGVLIRQNCWECNTL